MNMISILSMLVSLLALFGCIWRTSSLKLEIEELKATLLSKDDVKDFANDISARLVSSGNPVKDRLTAAVLSGQIDPQKVSLFDFYSRATLVPAKKRVTENSTTTETINE